MLWTQECSLNRHISHFNPFQVFALSKNMGTQIETNINACRRCLTRVRVRKQNHITLKFGKPSVVMTMHTCAEIDIGLHYHRSSSVDPPLLLLPIPLCLSLRNLAVDSEATTTANSQNVRCKGLHHGNKFPEIPQNARNKINNTLWKCHQHQTSIVLPPFPSCNPAYVPSSSRQ